MVFKGIVAYNICRIIGRGHSSAQNDVRHGSVHLEILSQLLFPIQSPGLLVAICTLSSLSPGVAVSCAFRIPHSCGGFSMLGRSLGNQGCSSPWWPFWENSATYPHKAKKGDGICNQSGGAQRGGKNRRLRIAKGTPQECHCLSRGAVMNTSH